MNNINKKKKKSSLRKEILLVFLLILFATVGLGWLVNTFFLERIYINEREDTVRNVYRELCAECENGDITSTEFGEVLQRMSVSDDVSIALLTSVFEPLRVYSREPEEKIISEMMVNLSGHIKIDKLIEQTEDYIIVQKHDYLKSLKCIEMWGVLPDGSFFLTRTALESVHQSARLASCVILCVGISTALIGSVFIFFFTKRFTKPILELTDIAERMSNMDFNAKYVGKYHNEIGTLGDSINKMSSNLESTISELKSANIELKKDNEEKDKVDQLRREFVANVSHELKTPIALIQGYAEGLKEGIMDKEDVDYYCDVIMDESSKMNQMVKQLINLNQLENGGDSLQVERFDLTTLIKNQVEKSDLVLKQNGIKVTLPSEPMFVWADEFKIEEVIMNFFSNAIHYCEAESGKRIDFSYEKEENSVKVNVFNTGNNIPEESLERIWDKFYKVDKARTRSYGGSGIGLSIVKAIVDAHNQRCGAYNVNDGVVFWFTIDVSDK